MVPLEGEGAGFQRAGGKGKARPAVREGRGLTRVRGLLINFSSLEIEDRVMLNFVGLRRKKASRSYLNSTILKYLVNSGLDK